MHSAPAWAGHDRSPAPAALTLPAQKLSEDAVLDLGPDGTALLCRVAPLNLTLRTPAEQQAVIGGFARYLNSLTTPVQILVRSTPVDLTAAVAAVRESAGGLPHPALEAAARDHADYLAGLAGSRDLLARDVLLVVRSPAAPPGGVSTDVVRRMATDAIAALAGCGLTVVALEAGQAAAVLAAAADPWAPPFPAGRAAPDATITETTGVWP